MTLKDDFTMSVSWGCPCCGAINNDKCQSSEGVISELWCYSCEVTINLETQTIKKEEE